MCYLYYIHLALQVQYMGFRGQENGKNSSKKGCECAVTTLCPFLKRSKGGIYKTLNNPRWLDNNVPSRHTVQKCACSESFCGYKFQVELLHGFFTVYDFVNFGFTDRKNILNLHYQTGIVQSVLQCLLGLVPQFVCTMTRILFFNIRHSQKSNTVLSQQASKGHTFVSCLGSADF